MIQRIQSLYLFVVAVLTGLMMFLPLARFITGDEIFKLTALGMTDAAGGQVVNAYGLTVVVSIASLLALVAIFLFKNRMLQYRLCVVEMIMLVGVLLFEVYYIWNAYSAMQGLAVTGIMHVGMTGLFPIISLIFAFLALRGIKKDIVLVKSLDRIR